MNTSLKLIILYISRNIGLFRISKFLTRKKLQILCYHGFELNDEASFRPKLFINDTTFHQRLNLIQQKKFHVLSLSDALMHLRRGSSLPDNSIVITIDDGFYSVYSKAASTLQKFKFPTTVYITTYYAVKENPIFGLTVQYIFWKTRNDTLHLKGFSWAKDQLVDMNDQQVKNQLMWEIIEHGEKLDSEEQRQNICKELGKILTVDYSAIQESRILSLMNAKEIKELSERGFDIQLHTHRHRLPVDKYEVTREIQKNREILSTIVSNQLVHFCYPSGLWHTTQWPWLAENAVESATTCLSGMNDSNTPVYGLNRFLDGHNINQIEFEAELCGFLELMRQCRSWIKMKKNLKEAF